MSRSLFIGDSHSHGYYEDKNNQVFGWGQANYAEIYSETNNKKTVIYSMPGACNKKYPAWVAYMLSYYNDIDEVFIQSTYWNRYLLAASKNADVGEDLPINHFSTGPNDLKKHKNDKMIERWMDKRITENHVELVCQMQPENMEAFKGFEFKEDQYTPKFKPFHEKFCYTKLWHESATHLQHREYCGDLFIISNLCKAKGIPLYIWSVNNRVFMPKNNYQIFAPLDNCIFADISAQGYFLDKDGLDIEDTVVDGEHYPYSIHEKIAKEYIPYLKSLTKT